MKIIIDITENEYRHIKEYYEKNDIVETTYSYIYHGTPLSDNATNGDIIKALFPNIETFEPNKYEIAIKQNLGWLAFKKDWWNTPYKEK